MGFEPLIIPQAAAPSKTGSVDFNLHWCPPFESVPPDPCCWNYFPTFGFTFFSNLSINVEETFHTSFFDLSLCTWSVIINIKHTLSGQEFFLSVVLVLYLSLRQSNLRLFCLRARSHCLMWNKKTSIHGLEKLWCELLHVAINAPN